MASNNRFRKVDEPDIAAVTVSLHQGENGTEATVTGPTRSYAGGIGFEVGPPMPILHALQTAVQLASRHGADIVVIDSEGLWEPQWGTLVSSS